MALMTLAACTTTVSQKSLRTYSLLPGVVVVIDVYVSLSDVLLNDVITHGALTAGAVRVDCCDISAKKQTSKCVSKCRTLDGQL